MKYVYTYEEMQGIPLVIRSSFLLDLLRNLLPGTCYHAYITTKDQAENNGK